MIHWLLCSALVPILTAQALAIEATMSRSVFYRGEASGTLSPLLEAYWQVDARSLHYSRSADSTITARYRTDVRVLSDTGIIREEHYIIATPPRPPEAAAIQSLLDLYRAPLPPGAYQIEIVLTEQSFPESTVTMLDSFTIDPPAPSAFLSDVQLLDTFYRTTSTDPFTRAGIRAVPLCANFLDDGRNDLHHYIEAYGLDRIEAARFPLRQRVYVSRKPADPPILHLQRIDTVYSVDFKALPHTLPIGTLASGNWWLNVLLEDKDGKPLAATRRAFQRLNTHPEDAPQPEDTGTATGTYVNLANTFLAKYKTPQIRAMLKMALPIADPPERAAINLLLDKPDDLYSRYFLYNFYNRRNAIKPEEAWKSHAERVREVNKLFGTGARPGYESDRGTLYLKYGAPSERILVRAEAGALPYEVWVYEVLPRTARQSFFLFYQPADLISDYRLLHSTVPDEVRNPGWRMLLFPGGRSGGVSASRAEQYFGNR